MQYHFFLNLVRDENIYPAHLHGVCRNNYTNLLRHILSTSQQMLMMADGRRNLPWNFNWWLNIVISGAALSVWAKLFIGACIFLTDFFAKSHDCKMSYIFVTRFFCWPNGQSFPPSDFYRRGKCKTFVAWSNECVLRLSDACNMVTFELLLRTRLKKQDLMCLRGDAFRN